VEFPVLVLVCHAARRIRAVWPRNFISAVKTSETAIVRRDSDRPQGIAHPFLGEDGQCLVCMRRRIHVTSQCLVCYPFLGEDGRGWWSPRRHLSRRALSKRVRSCKGTSITVQARRSAQVPRKEARSDEQNCIGCMLTLAGPFFFLLLLLLPHVCTLMRTYSTDAYQVCVCVCVCVCVQFNLLLFSGVLPQRERERERERGV